MRKVRGVEGDPILRAPDGGLRPGTVDVVAMSHLHFDHAGGLLDAEGRRAFHARRSSPRRAEWEVALDDNPRNVAAYDQPELRLVHAWGEEGVADGERRSCRGRGGPDRRAFGRPPGRRHPRPRGTVAFFGDLAMRPWSANPRWVTSFDDFRSTPSARRWLFDRAAEEGWTVLSHRRRCRSAAGARAGPVPLGPALGADSSSGRRHGAGASDAGLPAPRARRRHDGPALGEQQGDEALGRRRVHWALTIDRMTPCGRG
jgi:hypothetical protein